MGNKKKITITVVAEVTIDSKYYPNMTNEEISKMELENSGEWILDNIKSEKITVEDI